MSAVWDCHYPIVRVTTKPQQQAHTFSIWQVFSKSHWLDFVHWNWRRSESNVANQTEPVGWYSEPDSVRCRNRTFHEFQEEHYTKTRLMTSSLLHIQCTYGKWFYMAFAKMPCTFSRKILAHKGPSMCHALTLREANQNIISAAHQVTICYSCSKSYSMACKAL